MYTNPNKDATPMRTTRVSDGLSDAIAKGVDWLLIRQQEEGFWVGMLESNSCNCHAASVNPILPRKR